MCKPVDVVPEQSVKSFGFQRIDNRVKLITALIFIIVITNMSTVLPLLLALGFIVVLLVKAGVEVKQIYLRLLAVIPFVGVIVLVPFIKPGNPLFQWEVGFITLTASYQGMAFALVLFLKLLTAFLTANLLLATAGVQGILEAMQQLKFPGIFIILMDFITRYFELSKVEGEKMMRAMRARGFSPGAGLINRQTLRVYGNLLGMLFIRSFDRAERVYLAMLSRGYRGHIPPSVNEKESSGLKRADYCWGTAFFALSLMILFIDKGI